MTIAVKNSQSAKLLFFHIIYANYNHNLLAKDKMTKISLDWLKKSVSGRNQTSFSEKENEKMRLSYLYS